MSRDQLKSDSMSTGVGNGSDEHIRYRALVLDLGGYKLLADDRTEFLTLSQARLLAHLMAEPSRVHSIRSLNLALRGDPDLGEHALKVAISRLRCSLRRLGLGNAYLRSVRGLGYIFDPEPK